mgnify:CR=1 FL=1
MSKGENTSDNMESQKIEKVKEHELFRSLLLHTEDIINFYLPVADKDGEVVDFRIVQFNEMAKAYIQTKPEETIGSLLSEVYPFVKEKGGIDFLRSALNSNESQTRIREYLFDGEEKSLKTIVHPTSFGILATTIDISDKKNLQDKLSLSNSKLEAKILELESAKYFSQSVLDSSNNIIAFFAPIFDANSIIKDFKVDYINERIVELMPIQWSHDIALPQQIDHRFRPLIIGCGCETRIGQRCFRLRPHSPRTG